MAEEQVERDPNEMVTMTHPDGGGETTQVPRSAFEEYYQQKGWELAPEGEAPQTSADDETDPDDPDD